MYIDKFKNKEEFKEEFKRRIIEKYGRSIEQAHVTEIHGAGNDGS